MVPTYHELSFKREGGHWQTERWVFQHYDDTSGINDREALKIYRYRLCKYMKQDLIEIKEVADKKITIE